MLLFGLILAFLLDFAMPLFSLPSDASETLKMEERHLQFAGLDRTYVLYLPPTYDGKKNLPLLFLLHGGGGIGKRMVGFTGFDQIASKEGLIIVCPNGYERHWNCGRENTGYKAHEKKIDDVGFISFLLSSLTKELKVDSSRVYVSGISNGAMMSYRLGLEIPDKIAAIAPVVGALPEPFSKLSWTGRPLPAIIINGTKDPLVPFNGGDVHFYRRKLGRVISVPQTVEFWAKHNKCNASPTVTELHFDHSKSGLNVSKTEYKSCCNDADIEFYAVEGGGHTWPRDSRMAQYLPAAVIGKACRDIDASVLIWDFFKKHSLSANLSQSSSKQEN
ncbi:MAG: hypothetical protein K2X27_15195 [Candidatus Obscuribacterales bacterium]|nr:hypothetical protein [Candidatus Obscuribacterales bacterium]